jgi:hypothetical protein
MREDGIKGDDGQIKVIEEMAKKIRAMLEQERDTILEESADEEGSD